MQLHRPFLLSMVAPSLLTNWSNETYMRSILLVCGLVCGLTVLLTACSDTKPDMSVPKSEIEQRKERNGKITGEGITIVGKSDEDKASANNPLGVNSFLWRATLDTLSFMPLVSADPFGGVIITDWYEDPQKPGERFKVNALILDKTLRADGVKLTVFKQKIDKSVKNGWRDQQVDTALARSLEDTILTRARQMKLAQGK
jgi:hypothetical protein